MLAHVPDALTFASVARCDHIFEADVCRECGCPDASEEKTMTTKQAQGETP